MSYVSVTAAYISVTKTKKKKKTTDNRTYRCINQIIRHARARAKNRLRTVRKIRKTKEKTNGRVTTRFERALVA